MHGKETKRIMPLLFAPPKLPLRVVKVSHSSPAVLRHLLDLGVYEGSEITLIESINGAAVCDVKGSRLAFDHDISAGIQVAVA